MLIYFEHFKRRCYKKQEANMTGLDIMGIICLVIVGLFFPRTVSCIVLGSLLAGLWWWIFAPLAIIGFKVDVLFLKPAP